MVHAHKEGLFALSVERKGIHKDEGKDGVFRSIENRYASDGATQFFVSILCFWRFLSILF